MNRILSFFKRLFKKKSIPALAENYVPPKKQVYHMHNPPHPPVKVTIEREKLYKPRNAYTKRLWHNNKPLPKNMKDDIEDD